MTSSPSRAEIDAIRERADNGGFIYQYQIKALLSALDAAEADRDRLAENVKRLRDSYSMEFDQSEALRESLNAAEAKIARVEALCSKAEETAKVYLQSHNARISTSLIREALLDEEAQTNG